MKKNNYGAIDVLKVLIAIQIVWAILWAIGFLLGVTEDYRGIK